MTVQEYSYHQRTCFVVRFSNQFSITSQTGVGKTTFIKTLKETTEGGKYKYISMGDLMRRRASELGMTIEQFATHNKAHPEEGHDKWCDGELEKLAHHNWLISEGRLPHVWMPYACRVLLLCDPMIRAQRRQKDNPHLSIDEVYDRIVKRDTDDNERYKLLYPGCLWPEGCFDIRINTGQCSPEDSVRYLFEEHQKFLRRFGSSNIIKDGTIAE